MYVINCGKSTHRILQSSLCWDPRFIEAKHAAPNMKRDLEEGEEHQEEDAAKRVRAEEVSGSEEVTAVSAPTSAAADDAASIAAASAASAEANPASSDETANATAAASDAAASDVHAPSESVSAPSFAADHDGTSAAAAAPAAPEPADLSDEELVNLLKARAEAKSRRDFPTSDEIRVKLEGYGIKINDARQAGQMGTWSSADGRR